MGVKGATGDASLSEQEFIQNRRDDVHVQNRRDDLQNRRELEATILDERVTNCESSF